jgi:hypothetical protein
MTWWRRLRNRHALDTQLDRELRFHIEQHAADLIAGGIDPVEAQRRARLEIGGPEQVKEQCRDVRGTRWVDDLAQDVRYGIRALRQRAGFTAVAVSTLALGIGATTLMFTVIDGVLLKPLAYPDPDRLITVVEQTDWSNNFGNQWAFAYPNYEDCVRDTRSLTLAAWRFSGGTVTGNGDPEYVNAMQVSPEFVKMLGIGIDRGRSFLDSDDQPGAARVASSAPGFSQRHYGSGAAAVGAPLGLRFDAVHGNRRDVDDRSSARSPGRPDARGRLVPIRGKRCACETCIRASRCGAAPSRRDDRAGAIRAGARSAAASRSTIPIRTAADVHRGAVCGRAVGRCRRDALAVVGRGDARAAGRLREHRQPGARARGLARA